MLPLFYLAYGEGQISATASGIFLSLLVFALGCIAFIWYGYRTYPSDRS
ncbi:hypothetical protein IQ254_14380 [Nodosilinea sp. LEGE 07088]|nr:hypothetical protein [Nodosilinea sp. LEGE 07088]MBE9138359.1 hypothetical protein [Nodosilinea sp. LEGE 07088]